MVRLSRFVYVCASVVLITCSVPTYCLRNAGTSMAQTDGGQVDPALYLGTWQRTVSDATGTTRITLQLRQDGSYTKELYAVLRGHEFNNSEQGTWRADGPVVLCSGDGNAPASRHDLRLYQKLR